MEEKRGVKFRCHIRMGIVLALFILVNIFFNIKNADAAAMYFAPRSGTYAVGKTFSVGIYVSTGDSANAFQGTINFPEDKLQITSISKSGSVVSLWVQEPSFSNTDGAAHFAGIVPNPGYIGSSGKVLTINFKAKSSGDAHLSFSDGSILANDGEGTNILTSAGSADFILGGTGETASPSPEPIVGADTPNAQRFGLLLTQIKINGILIITRNSNGRCQAMLRR